MHKNRAVTNVKQSARGRRIAEQTGAILLHVTSLPVNLLITGILNNYTSIVKIVIE